LQCSGKGVKSAADTEQRIFPHLGRNNGERAATDISEMLQKCANIQDTHLHPDVSSKDLRSGPVAILYRELNGGVEITAVRGGWMIDDFLEKRTGALIFYLEVLELQVVV
jgi:plasmid stabilization system protein ParE